jgi:hypothetical protein
MGWTFYNRPKGETDRAHFEREFSMFRDGTYEMVETTSKNGVFYAAVRTLKDTGHSKAGEVWALVILMQRTRGEHNFGYKEMDETVGPGYYDAPARILDALTPTEHEWANQWRAECRKHLTKRETVKQEVRPGTVVELSKPVNFGDRHGTASRFEYERDGRRTYWWALDANNERRFRCRLGADWADRFEWKLVTNA